MHLDKLKYIFMAIDLNRSSSYSMEFGGSDRGSGSVFSIESVLLVISLMSRLLFNGYFVRVLLIKPQI